MFCYVLPAAVGSIPGRLEVDEDLQAYPNQQPNLERRPDWLIWPFKEVNRKFPIK